MHGLSAIFTCVLRYMRFKKFNFSAKTSLLLGIVDIYYSLKGQGGNVPNICTRHFVIIPILCQFCKSICTAIVPLHLVEMREILRSILYQALK